MSRDFNENTEDTSHVEQLSKEHDTSNLSDYVIKQPVIQID